MSRSFYSTVCQCTTSNQETLTEKSTVQVLGYPGIPGLNRHMVSKWLNSFPSEQTACREKWKLENVKKKRVKNTTEEKGGVQCAVFRHVSVCCKALQTYFDEMRANVGDHGRVALHHGRKPHLQLRFSMTRSLHYGLRLFTPRNKVFVIVHVGHDVIHLLHRVSEEKHRPTVKKWRQR